MSNPCLIDVSKKITCSNNITLSTNNLIKSTKIPSQGRWYYEYTQISGDQLTSIGFMLNGDINYRFSLFQRSSGINNVLYFPGVSLYLTNNKSEISQYHPIGFDEITTGITIGASYDTYTGLFSINIKNQIYSYIVSKITAYDKVEPLLLENSGGNFENNITVNFGPDFEYEIPQGYNAWCYNNKHESCYHKKEFTKSLYMFIMSLIFI